MLRAASHFQLRHSGLRCRARGESGSWEVLLNSDPFIEAQHRPGDSLGCRSKCVSAAFTKTPVALTDAQIFHQIATVDMAPALLLSLSEPGPNLPETEFHDWYDNDHIPARVASSVFQTWTRWVSIDGLKPTYANTYDLVSYQATKTAPYTSLVQNRSEHEKDVLKRISWIEPRVYEQYVEDPLIPASALYDPAKPAPYALFLFTELPEEHEAEFLGWYREEYLQKLSKAPGWVRSRQYKLRDWRRSGVEGSKNTTAPVTYFAFHEFATDEFSKQSELVQPDKTQRYEQMSQKRTSVERRVLKFLKKFERE